jgi:hypothetical protein
MVRRRRQDREQSEELGLPVRDLVDQHLLLVPTTVGVEQVHTLLLARVPDSDLLHTGEARLGRHSRITGPWELSMEDAVDAAVPMPWTVCYTLQAPVERESPPWPDLDDRDGFASAFPDGLPWREEARGLQLLVSLARRVQGAVRTAGTLQLIQPDPGRAVDHAVHAPFWLEPEVLLGVVGRVLPDSHLDVQGSNWRGPSDDAYSGALIAADTANDPLSVEQLAELHAAADRADLEAMARGPVRDGYAVVGSLGADGWIEVGVRQGEADEPAVVGQDWAGGPFITYSVRWVCPDLREREQRTPSPVHLQARARAARAAAAIAAVVVEASHGLVTDEDGFWLDRYQL